MSSVYHLCSLVQVWRKKQRLSRLPTLVLGSRFTFLGLPYKIHGMMVRNWTAILLISFVLVGCMRDKNTAVVTPTPTPETTRITTGAMARANTATPSPTARVLPTATPTATPIVPALTVADQVLHENGVVTITQAITPFDSWVVIRGMEADRPTGILGYTAVSAGVSQDITVTVEPLDVTTTLLAELYVDAGAPGEFEFPRPDEQLRNGETPVAAEFAATIEFTLPTLTVTDQVMAEDGVVHVDSVYTAVPSWLAIHSDDNGEPGAMLGFVYLDAGLHEDVVVPIPWHEASPYLLAALYADNGRAKRLDFPGEDQPILVNGEAVTLPFHVIFPPDVFILDQPVVNGEIVVERVVSDGPGWIVIHYDDNGEPGLIIGFAPLVDGVNEEVHVPLVETAVTDPLYIMLHQDTGTLGEFEFPRADPQVTYNDIVMTPISFGISPGNILYTQDQPLVIDGDTATVSVPLVIVDIDTWVVIYADINGQPGDILGWTWVGAGVNRNIAVTINPDEATDTLYVVLHHDADSDQEFDYPDGRDLPLQRNRQVIRSPFSLIEDGT